MRFAEWKSNTSLLPESPNVLGQPVQQLQNKAVCVDEEGQGGRGGGRCARAAAVSAPAPAPLALHLLAPAQKLASGCKHSHWASQGHV